MLFMEKWYLIFAKLNKPRPVLAAIRHAKSVYLMDYPILFTVDYSPVQWKGNAVVSLYSGLVDENTLTLYA